MAWGFCKRVEIAYIDWEYLGIWNGIMCCWADECPGEAMVWMMVRIWFDAWIMDYDVFEQWNLGIENTILFAGRFVLGSSCWGNCSRMNVTGEVVTEMGLREACTLVFWSLGLFWVTRFEKLVWLSSGTCETFLSRWNGNKYETWFLDLWRVLG